jgi:hypothetical protein
MDSWAQDGIVTVILCFSFGCVLIIDVWIEMQKSGALLGVFSCIRMDALVGSITTHAMPISLQINRCSITRLRVWSFDVTKASNDCDNIVSWVAMWGWQVAHSSLWAQLRHHFYLGSASEWLLSKPTTSAYPRCAKISTRSYFERSCRKPYHFVEETY